ncbi:DUF3987 domain-containing protein [Rhodoferax sp. GW822-FHT02A01]|uniref:DUF3987 domain-containing protein n=1 Tax=Rhodoferax sp. GW822-FHT02A01 TaxID=3141537 RepID=UPI00315C57A6
MRDWSHRKFTPVAPFPGLLGQMAMDLSASGLDMAIIRAQVIGFVSLLTQGCADVRWPNGQRTKIGTNVILLAPSGSGKSVVFDPLMEPITQFLNEQVSGVTQPAFLLEDATRAAIIEALLEWPVAGLFTDEAGQLDALMSTSASTLAKLLDGSPFQHARVGKGRAALCEHRFCMLLMEQPAIFERTKERIGARNGGVGLINRFILEYAKSHPISAALHNGGLSDSSKREYANRAFQLLGVSVQNVMHKSGRPVLWLSSNATSYLIDQGDEVRRRLEFDSRAAELAEYFNRHSERVLKLAGAMHVFEYGVDSEIDLATLHAADDVCRRAMETFAELTYVRPKLSQAEIDAATVNQALQRLVTLSGRLHFPMSDVRRLIANFGLTKHRFDRAVPVLASQGVVSVILHGRVDWLQIHSPYQQLLNRA